MSGTYESKVRWDYHSGELLCGPGEKPIRSRGSFTMNSIKLRNSDWSACEPLKLP